MRLVYIASEIMPFASTGGLAEVGGSLPRSLAKLGVDVIRIMPFYRQVAEGGFNVVDTGLRLDIPIGFQVHRAEVWVAERPEPITYFVRRDEYFDRTHLYGTPDRDYDDNFERFVFFQKAAISLIDALGLNPDILHCLDWQAGLVPLFARHGIAGMGRNSREKIVFTIHNLAYQGIFPGSLYSMTNLPFGCFHVDVLEFYGQINCAKAGLTGSDAVTVPSPTYAQEIQTEQAGFGLHGVLARISDRLIGILHGVDYSVWDPSIDPYLPTRYDANSLQAKLKCKERLIAETGLTISPQKPLLGMISRLVDHKGLDILADAMPSLMEMDIGFVLLGMGSEKYHSLCQEWMRMWPGRFFARLGYDVPFSHRIEAGADLYLMPSRFEPCGLNQLYSFRYGTVPVVHAVGGLEDTVVDVNADPERGTGFKFYVYTAEALLEAIRRALNKFTGDPAGWAALQKRIMALDFSWDHAAAKYLEVYAKLVG